MEIGGADLTAAEEVLLAAAKLSGMKRDEFTEWSLTVEAWLLNKNRWGLRGYEEKYPNHKRVMNEVMAAGTQKVLGRGWLERSRENHYRITASGLARAAELSSRGVDARPRDYHVYDALEPWCFHRVFESYLQDPNEPRTWLGVAAFLNLSQNDPEVLERQLVKIRTAISDAETLLREQGREVLRRGDSGKTISKERLERLRSFLEVVEARFAGQLSAIRRKRGAQT